MLFYAQYRDLLCCNHVTYCLFELVSQAEQENLSRLNVALCIISVLHQVSSKNKNKKESH